MGRRNRIRLLSGLVVVAAAVSLVAYAIATEGYATRHVALNDGGIWVTNGLTGQFGRLNKPVRQLDGTVYSLGGAQASYAIDVLQDGAAVVAEDQGKGRLYPIDVAGLKASEDGAVDLPADSAVAVGGGVIAVLDRAKGAIRAMTFDPSQVLSSIAALGDGKPVAQAGPDAALAVGSDGTIYAASTERGLTTIAPDGAGFSAPRTQALGQLSGQLSLTAVGDTPVVLASPPAAGEATVLVPGEHPVTVGAGAVLQQAGPLADAVLVATPRALLSVPLGGGAARTLFDHGSGEAPAAPVRLGGCVFGAWAGAPGVYAGSCAGAAVLASPLTQPSTRLAFRINRGQLILNDLTSGRVWDVDDGTPQQVANWDKITPPRQQPNTKNHDNHAITNQSRPLPPKAVDDQLGARPGRTTPLYVLDNDSDPSGDVLAVDSVSASAPVAKWLSIAPDGQTVDITLPPGTTGDTTFKYVVRAARGGTATATVVVHARTPSQNAPPTLRTGYLARTWTVPESGTVTIPVLADWRDYVDGDPVALAQAKASAGQVSTTPDGALIYTAPAGPGPQTIDYTVDDGMGATAKGSVRIQVQRPDDQPVAPVAEPDYARGEVGKPIVVSPLLNDLPGSDPLHPTATMQLTGTVASPAGTTVQTDPAHGTVTVVATHPGTYSLAYHLSYGGAAPATGTIRVDVDPASAAKPPITAPDSAVLHGQVPVTVDVLANDSDPAGNLLAVERATAEHPDQLQVAVVGGQFVRVLARVPQLSPATQTVTYTVTDGVTGPVTGQITVTQLPAPADDTPITLADYATVRAGTSTAIPVLDNDSTPAGDPLSLVRDVPGAPGPGQYTVTPRIGAAYVSGNLVRYVAPSTITQPTTVTIDYYAQDQAGDQQQVGHAQVTITPPVSATNPDQPPVPAEVDARTVAGDTIQIKVPTTGVDPDGDPVVVTGIGSGTQLGRVLAFTASTITYQAYPQIGNGGTDTFAYTVNDTQGLSAQGTVRVAVVSPGDPQPPVAVDDAVTVAPGATVLVDAMSNDLVAPDDNATITGLSSPGSTTARLLSPTGPIQVTASSDPKHPLVLTYRLTDGLSTSAPATVTVRSQTGVDLPPVAFDQYASPKTGATAVTVDLLHNDYDPDSASAPTVVSPATAVSGKLTVTLTARPQVIPYVIADAGGARASAVVYVPGTGAGLPYPKPGAQLTVPAGGERTVDIADYVIDPAGRPLRLTTTDTLSASPADGLTVRPAGNATHLRLVAGKNYSGPAEVTFQVTDGKTLADTTAAQAYITLPVQVGNATPVLRCPSDAIPLTEGGPAQAIAVATVCHVWTADPADAARVTYRASWQRQPAGVNLTGSGSPVLQLQATGAARPGGAGAGLVAISATGSSQPPQTLAVQVVQAPPLTLSPITVDGVKAGESKTIDVAAYVSSPFGAGAVISVVGQPQHTSGLPASVSAHGSQITLSPGADSHDTITLSFVVTDVADRNRTDRQVPGVITLHVLGHPGAPTNLAASRTVLSDEVDLTWTAPPANGSPIDHYVVDYGSGSQHCGAAPACAVKGLRNGTSYTFTVTAYNAVGQGPASGPTSATPNAPPGAVRGLTVTNPQDHSLTVSWLPLTGDFSPVTQYTVQWSAGGAGGSRSVGAGVTRLVVTGLDNDQRYLFSVIPWNKQGHSSASPQSVSAESAGRPALPAAPSVSVTDDLSNNDRVVTLTWAADDPQGPAPTHYTVNRTSAAGAVQLCVDTTVTTCRDTGVKLDGTVYNYAVSARNSEPTDPAAHTSGYGPNTAMEAAATPGAFGPVTATPTGTDNQVSLQFDAPPSHGAKSTITCTANPGGNCGSWDFPPAGQSGITETVNGLANGTATSITLQECNGSSGTNFSGTSCVNSAPVTVTPYGPIGPVSVAANPSGTNVNWSVSVNPNGKPVTVHVSNNHGWSQDYTTGVGAWSTSGSDNVGYSTNDTISVTVTDTHSASGPDRTGTSGSGGATTGPPPAAVTASRGGATSNCGANVPNCFYLDSSVSNFTPGRYNYTCFATVNGQLTQFTNGSFTVSVPANGNVGPYCWGQSGYQMPYYVRINGVMSNPISW